jgi:hypothetical protein
MMSPLDWWAELHYHSLSVVTTFGNGALPLGEGSTFQKLANLSGSDERIVRGLGKNIVPSATVPLDPIPIAPQDQMRMRQWKTVYPASAPALTPTLKGVKPWKGSE